MRVVAEAADDPAAMRVAVESLPLAARELLDQLLLVARTGEPLPDRLRERIATEAGPLWAAAVLLPRATAWQEGSLHPQHYAGSCRLNPAVGPWAFSLERGPAIEAPASFPPADARGAAVVVAALLEAVILGDGSPTYVQIVRLLVEHRANVNIADREGVSPTAHAKRRDFREIAQILERAGGR